jgi:hypothetical protein
MTVLLRYQLGLQSHLQANLLQALLSCSTVCCSATSSCNLSLTAARGKVLTCQLRS